MVKKKVPNVVVGGNVRNVFKDIHAAMLLYCVSRTSTGLGLFSVADDNCTAHEKYRVSWLPDMMPKPTKAQKCMKVYYTHCIYLLPVAATLATFHSRQSGRNMQQAHSVYNIISYTFVPLSVLVSYLTAQFTVMENLKLS